MKKLVTWNVNGIRASYNKGLRDFIKSYSPDILCLQEVKAHREQAEPAVQTLDYNFQDWHSAKKKGYSGVATFSKEAPLDKIIGIGLPEYDDEGRILRTVYSDFELYNIYFPNGGSGEERHSFKQRFLSELYGHLKKSVDKGAAVVVVGDYNVAHKEIDVYDPVRLAKESGFLPEEREWFSRFLDLGFVDLFRKFYPNSKDRFSWWSYREYARVNNRGWRIDYICCTKNVSEKFVSCDVLDKIEGSDHCPVIAEYK